MSWTSECTHAHAQFRWMMTQGQCGRREQDSWTLDTHKRIDVQQANKRLTVFGKNNDDNDDNNDDFE